MTAELAIPITAVPATIRAMLFYGKFSSKDGPSIKRPADISRYDTYVIIRGLYFLISIATIGEKKRYVSATSPKK